MDYLVTKINIKDDYVKITIETSITVSNFLIRVIDYLDLALKLNSSIDEAKFDKLSEMHKSCYAYKKCLNKLANKDYSVKEIEELLESFQIENVKEILDEFINSGLLNDEELVKNYFEVGQIRKIGKKKLYFDLKKRKVLEELIKKYYCLVDDNIEIENGCQIALKYFESLKGVSYKDALNKVKLKLVNLGFGENIGKIMNKTDFKTDEENEYNNLAKAYQKALHLFQNKYQGVKLRQHLFNNLYSKGYKTALIYKILGGQDEN